MESLTLNLPSFHIGLIYFQIDDLLCQYKNIQTLNLIGVQIDCIHNVLTSLQYLKEMDLSSNNITHIIKEIVNLKNLQVLNLSENQISVIDSSIFDSNFINTLQVLFLDDNQLNFIPTEVGNLKVLHTLSLTRNQIEVIPKSIFKMDSLKHFSIGLNILKALPLDLINMTFESIKVRGNTFDMEPGLESSNDNIEFPSLQEIAARACPKSILKSDVAIPTFVRNYINSDERCYNCDCVVVNSFVNGCIRMSFHTQSRRLPFVGKFCSKRCFENYNETVFLLQLWKDYDSL